MENTSLKPTKSKKDQILDLFAAGVQNIDELATLTESRTSYVAAVLQAAGHLSGYFDLYTTSTSPMNVYSKLFAGKLGFKDEEAARQGVETLNRAYMRFARAKDRAGQHHALSAALTMCDRARFSGKHKEAAIYRRWLIAMLHDTELGRPKALDELMKLPEAS